MTVHMMAVSYCVVKYQELAFDFHAYEGYHPGVEPDMAYELRGSEPMCTNRAPLGQSALLKGCRTEPPAG
jgi:hypothetical protein